MIKTKKTNNGKKMKNYFLVLITSIFIINISVAVADTSECDKITGALKMGKKMDCLIALKKKTKKTGDTSLLKSIDDQITSIEQKKKKFDDENPTLWKMFKNMKK